MIPRFPTRQATDHRSGISEEDWAPHSADVGCTEHSPAVAIVAVELLDSVLCFHHISLIDDLSYHRLVVIAGFPGLLMKQEIEWIEGDRLIPKKSQEGQV